MDVQTIEEAPPVKVCLWCAWCEEDIQAETDAVWIANHPYHPICAEQLVDSMTDVRRA